MKKKKSNKRKGMRFEDSCQKTINSGSFDFDKGDLKTDQYVIECKFTNKKSFRITTKILEKIWNDALDSNKLPLIMVGIEGEKERWKLIVNIEKENI